MDHHEPFILILIIISVSIYVWALQYFIARAKLKYPPWTHRHTRAFVFSLAQSRQSKAKIWRNIGLRDHKVMDSIIKIQTAALFLSFLAAALGMGTMFSIFKTWHWL